MNELVFFSLEGVKVSSKQFVVDELAYDIKDVKDVHHAMIEPKRALPILCMLSGTFLLLLEDIFMVAGGFAIALGLFALLTAKTFYSVVIETPEGEKHALKSENSDDVSRVVTALHSALIHTGSLMPLKENIK